MIEIRPGSFINKGGHLMAIATVAALGKGARFAAEPWIAPYADRARLGLHQKLWVRRLGPLAGLPAAAIPGRLRRTFGIVGEPDIDAVLDLSGFRYSDDDRYGARSANELATNATRWHAGGSRVVLLPQALGPFRSAAVRDPFLRALDAVDLVFARDRRSLAHLQELLPNDERVALAPDCTIALAADRPHDLAARVTPGAYAAIVPNDRMLERTSPAVQAAYPGFLLAAMSALRDRGIEPVVVLHESRRDRAFVERLRLGGRPPSTIEEHDPLVLKGILGGAAVVLSSRYHALVSALSQAVPVVATGWSHKYEELLADFGCSEQMLEVGTDHAPLLAAIERATDRAGSSTGRDDLRERAMRQRFLVEAMWERVRSVVGLPRAGVTEATDGPP